MGTGFESVPPCVAAGDRLVVRAHHQGQPERDAVILEVLGEQGHPPYRVRWMDDGHETIVYPGSDVFIEHLNGRRRAVARRKARP
jgi:Domain of unknown function (DUF1918)